MCDALLSPLVLGNRLCRVCSLSLGGFQLVAAGLCEEAVGSLQVGGPSCGIPIYQCACLCGVLVKGPQLSADFHVEFLYHLPKMASYCFIRSLVSC